jgi:hypothetical protein
VDDRNQPVGRISDLLIDLTSRRPTMVILAPPRNGLDQSACFALALSSLKAQKENTFRINASPKNFALAPALNDAAWLPQRPHGITIYRFQ